MKKSLLFLSLILIVLASSCNPSKLLTSENDELLKDVKHKYAPDSRVAIFNIKAIQNGEKIYLFGETTSMEAKEELLIRASSCQIRDSILVLPGADVGSKSFGIVKLSVCNIRSNPRHSSELATQAILGTPVSVLKKQNGWYLIQTPDKYLGWVDGGGIVVMDNIEKDQWQKSTKVIFTDRNGSVFESPDLESGYVSDIVGGSILKFIEKSVDSKFWKVGYPDGREGYISMHSADLLNLHLAEVENYNASDVISSAFLLKGIPYLWGGTSSKAADCSGFTKTAYFMQGIILPRDASQQVNIGEKVTIDKDFSKLKKGDLLFFGTKRKDGSDRITHVAIYLGDGAIIHATGEVKVESLKKGEPDFVKHRLNTLMQVRRIIGNEGKYGVQKLINVKSYWE